jgi:hypothetical protein
MLVDYFNGCVRARSLNIAAQIKNMGVPLLVFGMIFVPLSFSYLQKNTKLCRRRKV